MIGGRWKPLHYMLARSIFADVQATCGAGGVCYVRSDRPTPFAGTLTVTAVTLATGATRVVYSAPALALPAGPGAALWFNVDAGINGNTTVLVADVYEAPAQVPAWRAAATYASPLAALGGGAAPALVSSNLVLLAPPAALAAPAAAVAFTVADAVNADGTVDITLTTDAPALFVTLTALAQGRFSDNAFLLLPGAPRVVTYIPFVAPTDYATLATTLRVEHAASYAQ